MSRFAELLGKGTIKDGGDMSLVLASLQQDPSRLDELVACLRHADELVRARAVAVLERLSRTHPEYVAQAKPELLQLARDEEVWSTRMHVARLVHLTTWSDSEYEPLLLFLFSEAEAPNKFAAAWALDALAHFALNDDSIRARTIFLLEESFETGSPALRSRCQKCLAMLRPAQFSAQPSSKGLRLRGRRDH